MIASITLLRRASRRGGRLLPKALGGVTRPACLAMLAPLRGAGKAKLVLR